MSCVLVSRTIFRFVWKVSRLLILILPVIGLVFSVPWFFNEDSGERFLGLPSWVVYALLVASGYALLVAFLIGRFWDVSAGPQEEDE